MSTLTVETRAPSRFQTTEIIDERFPGRIFYGEGFCPILPPEWQASFNNGEVEEIQIRCDKDDSLVTWYDSGVVEKCLGSSITIWYPKPTLKAMVENRLYDKNSYTEFRSDGCVVRSRPDLIVPFFWGPEIFTVEPMQGEVVYKYMIDYDTTGYYDTDESDSCGCRNAYRCCGYDSPDYGRD